MGFTALIDVAIGLMLIYLGAALFVTAANEFIGQILNLRAKQLAESLQALLNLEQIRLLVPQNPQFSELDQATKRSKSYVDPIVVAQSMVGTLRVQVTGATRTMQGIIQQG